MKTNQRLLRFNDGTLPKLPGVYGLSATEVRNDFKEIKNNGFITRSTHSDTDSECSVLTEDVLPSTYPVKPRRILKAILGDTLKTTNQLINESEKNGAEVDEALRFIKELNINNSDLYSKEAHRESLEALYQSYLTSIEILNKDFIKSKESENNYIRFLQGLYARSLRIHQSLCQQNVMLLYSYNALKLRKEAVEKLTKVEAILKLILDDKKNLTKSDNDVQVLKVFLRKSNKDVILFVGQNIMTPMGQGIILQIQPKSEKVVIKLSYGLLYATLGRMVCWGGSSFDVSCDTYLVNIATKMKEFVTLSFSERLAIHNLLSTNSFADDDAMMGSTDSTDKDEDTSSNGDSPSVNNTNEDASVVMLSQQDENYNEVKDINQISANTTTTNNNNINNNNNNNVVNRKNVLKVIESNPTILSLDYHQSYFPLGCSSSIQVDGMNVNNASDGNVIDSKYNSRSNAKKILDQHLSNDFQLIPIHSLPLCFVPTESTPYVVNQLNTLNCTNNILAKNYLPPSVIPPTQLSIIYQPSALVDDDHNRPKLGTTANLAGDGNIDDMKRSLAELNEMISSLEAEKCLNLAKIEQSKILASNLTMETSALRLGMFTRRVTHRNTLANQGIVLNTAPVIQNGGGNKQNRNSLLNNAIQNQTLFQDNEPISVPVPAARSMRSKITAKAIDDMNEGESATDSPNNSRRIPTNSTVDGTTSVNSAMIAVNTTAILSNTTINNPVKVTEKDKKKRSRPNEAEEISTNSSAILPTENLQLNNNISISQSSKRSVKAPSITSTGIIVQAAEEESNEGLDDIKDETGKQSNPVKKTVKRRRY
eukprot:gene8529-11529_t